MWQGYSAMDIEVSQIWVVIVSELLLNQLVSLGGYRIRTASHGLHKDEGVGSRQIVLVCGEFDAVLDIWLWC